MSAKLYTNIRGVDVTRHSYSSGVTWDRCKRLYQLEKIKNIRRKDVSAAMAFGKAIEDGIQAYHANGLRPDSGIEEFERIWRCSEDNTDFVFTAKERDWSNLMVCGQQLLKLYEILLPTFPITDPTFQVSYSKTIFPGTSFESLEHGGFVDLVSRPVWDHPMLPKAVNTDNLPWRPLICDIKTSGAEMNITADMLELDQQLQVYSWLSGIPDVSFLVMVKGIADSFKRGTEVTFLTASENWSPGDRAVVFEFDAENGTVLLTTHEGMQRIKGLLDEIKGKGATERKETLIAGLVADNDLLSAPVSEITKMRIQFLAVRISDENVREAGEVIAHQMVEIEDATRTGFYPKHSGVRFPNNHCLYCAHRGCCTGNQALVDKLLVQITPAIGEIDDDYTEDWGFGGDEG